MILNPQQAARIYGRRKPQPTLSRARRLARELCLGKRKPLVTEEWIDWAALKIARFANRTQT